jgi:1,4-dihydroxy-2-naphthoate octaprenyltransferase
MFLGPRMGRWLYAGLVVGSALGAAALGLAGVLPWPAVFCPLALAAAARPLRHVLSGRRLANVDALTARYAALLMVALIAVLLWCE